ncbi:adenosine kinase, partial [archaeon]
DENKSKEVLERIKGSDMKVVPGGSAANTLAILAILGSKAIFCGKVGHDEYGDIYETGMIESNVKSSISKIDRLTGHAITFITPDFERTFIVHLGAALHMSKDDIIEDEIAKSKILHIEGYQLEGKSREIAIHVMDLAKKHGTKISIDLADAGLIKRNLADLKKITSDYADIIFANEMEAETFTGLKGEAALDEMSRFADTCVLKLGEKGSMIKQNGSITRIDSFKTNVVDSTGAGDAYAAGFLHGICNGMSLEKSGNLASFIASKVVSQIGSRLDVSILEDIRKMNLI